MYAYVIKPSTTTATGQRFSTPIRNRASGEIMRSKPFDGTASPSLPTLSDIQRRMEELASIQQRLDTQTQLQSRPAPRTPPPPSAPPNPTLREAALYGVAGMAVRALAPHTEAHPAAILLQLLAAFGNAVGPAPTAWSRLPAMVSPFSWCWSANPARPARGQAGTKS